MKREIKRDKKIRTTICLDEELFLKSGEYIKNLSGFFNKCLKNQIEKMEASKDTDSHKNLLCQIPRNEKKSTALNNELLDTNYQWWTD